MTLDEARKALARDPAPAVLYRPREHRPWSGPPEQGVITDVGRVWVFVRYGVTEASQATSPADLELLRTGSEHG